MKCFSGHIPATLSYSQAAILLTLGLQCKTVDDIAQDLGLPASQILALFSKSIRKLHAHLHAGKQAQIARKLPARKELKATTSLLKPYAVGVDEDLEEGAAEIQKEYENYKAQALSEKELGNLEQYAIKGTAEDVAKAATGAELTPGGLISVKVSSKDTKEKKKKGRKQRDETAGDSKKTKKKKSKR